MRCFSCGREFSRKFSYRRHLFRSTTCAIHEENISLYVNDEEYVNYVIEVPELKQIHFHLLSHVIENNALVKETMEKQNELNRLRSKFKTKLSEYSTLYDNTEKEYNELKLKYLKLKKEGDQKLELQEWDLSFVEDPEFSTFLQICEKTYFQYEQILYAYIYRSFSQVSPPMIIVNDKARLTYTVQIKGEHKKVSSHFIKVELLTPLIARIKDHIEKYLNICSKKYLTKEVHFFKDLNSDEHLLLLDSKHITIDYKEIDLFDAFVRLRKDFYNIFHKDKGRNHFTRICTDVFREINDDYFRDIKEKDDEYLKKLEKSLVIVN